MFEAWKIVRKELQDTSNNQPKEETKLPLTSLGGQGFYYDVNSLYPTAIW